MIIFLYGPDDYRRIQKKREIVAEFEKKHSGLGLAFFDLADADAMGSLLEFIRNQSIFESAKLAVLLNAFEAEPKELAKALAPLAAGGATTILVSEREKPVKALAFLAVKPSLCQQFDNLEGAEWAGFIKTEAKRAGAKLTGAAAAFLGTVYQGNSWALVTELQKLATFRAAALIDKGDLDAMDLEAAPNYWALLNGLKSYDARVRLFALEKLFALSDPPAKIFNILAAQAGEKIPRMAGYDIAVKSGKLDYEEALLDFAIS
jgi:DNA polymerase III delta subunit